MITTNIQTEFQKLHNVLTRFKADLPSNDLLELDTFFKVYENIGIASDIGELDENNGISN